MVMPSKPQSQYKSHAGIERSKKEEQEYGPGRKDITFCEDCDAVYYNKSWHHKLRDYKYINEDKRVNFAVCPVCQMIREGKFEGKVTFQNVPKDYKKEIINNIRNTGERAYKRDPLDRIISVKDEGRIIEVLTTENQLAVNIARQVKRAFKKFDVDISWSKDESVVRVEANFK